MQMQTRVRLRTWAMCWTLCLVTATVAADTAPLKYVEQPFNAAGTQVAVRLPADLKLELLTDIQIAESQIERGEGIAHETARESILEKIRK